MVSDELITDLKNIRVRYRGTKRRLWEPVLKKYSFNIVCEIGVQNGFGFEELIRHNPEKAVAVDIWKADDIVSHNDGGFTQEELNNIYNNFVDSMKDKHFVDIRRGYSFDVVKEFPDNYFDFVYIDADHTYEGCFRDITDWYPKVKFGGVLVGDDFVRNYKAKRTGVVFGVVEAVQQYCKENLLEYFEIPGHGWGILKSDRKVE